MRCTAGVMCWSQTEGTASTPAVSKAFLWQMQPPSLHHAIPGCGSLSAVPAQRELVPRVPLRCASGGREGTRKGYECTLARQAKACS